MFGGLFVHDPSSDVLCGDWSPPAMQLQEHQRLIDMTPTECGGYELAQDKEGSRGAGGHGVTVRLPSSRARFGFGRPDRPSPLLGSLPVWECCGCS